MRSINTTDEMLDLLKEVPEPMLHMYKGLYTGLIYAADGQDVEIHEEDLGMEFSPSFSNPGPVAFYEEPLPKADDLITHNFNPVHFLAVAGSLDMEAAINYINVKPGENIAGRYWKFIIRCTEGDNPPDDEMTWRNFGHYNKRGQYVGTN